MICNIRGNDNFYTILISFLLKNIKMIMVWFLWGFVPNISLQNIICRPGHLYYSKTNSLWVTELRKGRNQTWPWDVSPRTLTVQFFNGRG